VHSGAQEENKRLAEDNLILTEEVSTLRTAMESKDAVSAELQRRMAAFQAALEARESGLRDEVSPRPPNQHCDAGVSRSRDTKRAHGSDGGEVRRWRDSRTRCVRTRWSWSSATGASTG
jgi:hypothetical protein